MLPGGTPRLLFLVEHRSPRDGRREPRGWIHVAEFLSDQRDAPRRREYARRLSARRRSMVGTVATSELTAPAPAPLDHADGGGGGVRFALATREHEAQLRRLLRNNPM